MDTTFDPFAEEGTAYDETFPAPAALSATTEDEFYGQGEQLNTIALNAGRWQGDCREWQ